MRESEAAIVREIVARVMDKHAQNETKSEAGEEDTTASAKEDAVGYSTWSGINLGPW